MTDDVEPLPYAIADLAEYTGAGVGDIEVVLHEQVTWRDGSMGCPQPGVVCSEALVGGYRIVLSVGGQQVAYHGARGRLPFRCDSPDPNGAVETQVNS